MPDQQRPHLVTDRDLENQLSKYPTKWEVRALVAIAALAGRFVPAGDIAQAAHHVASGVPGLFQ